MFGADPEISFRAALTARAFQAVFPLQFRLQYSSRELQFATKPIAKPGRVSIPTRHGEIEALVYSPTDEDLAAARGAGEGPPVHLITHGGGFILRKPDQEDNVARYLASELGAYVVVPDFDTAPTVRHPVSEQQAYDAFVWVHENGAQRGWDGERASVGGPSAGGQVAFGVVSQAIDAGGFVPVAVSSEFGVADLSLQDEERPSSKKRPVVGPWLMQLVRDTYFLGADLKDPLVSPAYYSRLSEFPPTLVITAELDTLHQEMNRLAADMAAKGVEVTYKEFPGVDHGFTHTKPADLAREAIRMIGEHLRKAYGGPAEENKASAAPG